MLSIHKLFLLSSRWAALKESRPSTLRYTLLFWILRVIFGLLFIVSIIGFWTTYSRELWLPLMKGQMEGETYEAMDEMLMGMRVLFGFVFIVSGLITWLCSRSLRRNEYIQDLEQMIEEYHAISVEYNANNQPG